MSRLRPMFGYYGSKWRAAPHYPEPQCDIIIEPFAGSAAYALLHYYKQIWLNDLNPRVASVWRYLINVSKEEIFTIPLIQNADDMDKLIPEQRYLIGFWWGKALVEPASRPTGWLNEHNPTYTIQYWGETRRQRIANQIDKIKHWKITELPYQELPNTKATWFIDPPYSNAAGRAYTLNTIDYQFLGEWCKKRKGQIIVCENVGARWLPFQELGTFKTARKGKSIEAIWTNYYD